MMEIGRQNDQELENNKNIGKKMTCCFNKNKQLNQRRLLCKKARDGVFSAWKKSEKSAMNCLFINLTGICVTKKKPISLLTF